MFRYATLRLSKPLLFNSIVARRIISNAATKQTEKGSKAVIIKTLDPAHLQTSDFLDMSNLSPRIFKVALKDGQIVQVGHLQYFTSRWTRDKLPSGTKGFLYWHHDVRLPPTTGQVRFRVTADSNPASFEQGTDLMGPQGILPWSLNILRLAVVPRYAAFVRLAIADGYLPPHFLAHASKWLGTIVSRHDTQVLTFLEQPFTITVPSHCRIDIITPTLHIYQQQLSPVLPRNFENGKLLVRFEHATLAEHPNDTSIVMRVLKILEPVQQGTEAPPSNVVPIEGALLKYDYYGKIRCRVFRSAALRLLPSIIDTTYIPPADSNIEIEGSLTNIATLQRTIFSTLNPRRLRVSDCLNLSDTFNKSVYHVSDLAPSLLRWYSGGGGFPFPPATQGFLYLHHNPSFSPLAAEIRFRLVPSGDPALFETGEDLFGHNGEVWKISVLQLPHRKHLASLLHCLQDEGPPEVAQALIAAARLPVAKAHRTPLTYLEQPFAMDMSKQTTSLHLATPEQFHDLVLRLLPDIYYRDRTSKTRYAIRGRLVFRFERSPLPEHALGNFVVLRVLKVLEPVEFNGVRSDSPLPHPGELLRELIFRKISMSFDELPVGRFACQGLPRRISSHSLYYWSEVYDTNRPGDSNSTDVIHYVLEFKKLNVLQAGPGSAKLIKLERVDLRQFSIQRDLLNLGTEIWVTLK
ncbi:hypothetical protein DXG01_003130 [Tephrocybe rancida]|nr:hypothetical protein DXG01_003130 [Tephrocybe rancida]